MSDKIDAAITAIAERAAATEADDCLERTIRARLYRAYLRWMGRGVKRVRP